jgi:recombinational DNA repair protein (RecF pathway)
MSYGVYHTDMIVLDRLPRGEANVLFTLLTRDLGIIRAQAQSVRKNESKLRYGLQYLSMGTVDVIRAKDTWRIVGAEPQAMLLPNDIYHKPLHRIIRLATRILPHDETIDGLFEILHAAQIMLSQRSDPSQQRAIDLVTVARLLWLGGYWNESLSVYVETIELTDEDIAVIQEQAQVYTASINTALRLTHL